MAVRTNSISPKDVHKTLKKHMLAEGFDDIVVDFQKSQGAYLYDSLNNRKLLDFFTFFATYPLGYNHPKMKTKEFKEKLEAVSVIKPSNSDFFSIQMAEFVEMMSKTAIPKNLPHLFLIDGGGLAVENALKTAFDWKIRKNIKRGLVDSSDNEKQKYGTGVIHFKESFHGRTGYTLSLTNTTDPRKYKYFPKFNWPRFPNPKITFPLNKENLEKVKKAETESVALMEHYFKKHPNSIAGIIIEPIQGEGGDNHFRPEFFKELRRLADKYEALLIYDEIQTGLGLTGEMWAYENYGVEPDILCFGKKFQVCGILAGKRIDEVNNNVFAEKSRLNSSWGGNLIDMVRATRILEIVAEDKLIENAKKQGKYFLAQLENLQKKHKSLMSSARGKGLFCAFDLPNDKFRDNFITKARKNNLLLMASGVKSVRFRPQLDITKKDLDLGIKILDKCLS